MESNPGKCIFSDFVECSISFEWKTFISFFLQFQLAAFASKYIQRSNLPSVSKLTADHVVNMGHFLCGLTASDIGLVPNEVYE